MDTTDKIQVGDAVIISDGHFELLQATVVAAGEHGRAFLVLPYKYKKKGPGMDQDREALEARWVTKGFIVDTFKAPESVYVTVLNTPTEQPQPTQQHATDNNNDHNP